MKHYLQNLLIKKSNIVLLIIIISVLMAITGYSYYRHESRTIRQERENDLKAIASLKVDQISDWYLDEIHYAEIISRNIFLVEMLENWLRNLSGNNRKMLIQHLSVIITEHGYEDILLTATDGQILLSTDDKIEKPDSVLIRNIIHAVASQSPVLVDFYYCSVHHKIHINFISPVLDAQSIPIAVMVFQIDPEKFLFPLIQSWPLPSKSSETLIVRQYGDCMFQCQDLYWQ